MKKNLIVFSLILVLSLSIVSTISWGNIFLKATGQVINEEWCEGSDFNKDGKVDNTDKDYISECFGLQTPRCLTYDLSKNGVVDISDIALLAEHYGKTNCGRELTEELGVTPECEKDLCLDKTEKNCNEICKDIEEESFQKALFKLTNSITDLKCGLNQILGDLDDNGEIQALDASIILLIIEKKYTLNNIRCADVDCDKQITNRDAQLIIQDLGGTRKGFSCGDEIKPILIIGDGNLENKINVIFVPDGYEESELELFKKEVDKLIDEEGFNYGFFSIEPFKSNKDKFNIFRLDISSNLNYWNLVERHNWEDLTNFIPDYPNIQTIIITKKNIRYNSNLKGVLAYALPAIKVVVLSKRSNSVQINSKDKIDFGGVLLHEFGHSFVGLSDEYLHPLLNKNYDPSSSINCDELACPKWCSGELIDLKSKWSNINCESFSKSECAKYDPPCILDKPYSPNQKCVNALSICLSLDETTCTSEMHSENCELVFIEEEDSEKIKNQKQKIINFWGNNCISLKIGYNNKILGADCIEGASCYKGCLYGTSNFRSTEYSIMNSPYQALFAELGIYMKSSEKAYSYGPVSEKALLEKINELTSPSIEKKIINVESNLIYYDEFDEQVYTSGGLIDLEDLVIKEELKGERLKKSEVINLKGESPVETDFFCENNFECKSNICIENQCLKVSKWQKFLNFIRNMF